MGLCMYLFIHILTESTLQRKASQPFKVSSKQIKATLSNVKIRAWHDRATTLNIHETQ